MNKVILIIGLAFILLSAGAYLYQVSETDSYLGGAIEDTDIVHPYRDYSFPMFIGGVVLIVIALTLNQNKNQNLTGGKK